MTTCPYFSSAEKCCVWSVTSTMPSMAWYASPCITTVKSDVVGSAPKRQHALDQQRFIDIRLHPGRTANSWQSQHVSSHHLSALRPLRPNVTSSIKPEVHNIAQSRRRTTEPRPQGIHTQNFVPIGPAVPKICLRTDRQIHTQTDRQVDHNTLHPYQGGVMTKTLCLLLSVLMCDRIRLTQQCHMMPAATNALLLTFSFILICFYCYHFARLFLSFVYMSLHTKFQISRHSFSKSTGTNCSTNLWKIRRTNRCFILPFLPREQLC